MARSNRVVPRTSIVTIVALLSVSWSRLGYCESLTEGLKNIFRSSMNDVATKVADLPEKYHDVIVRGVDFSPDGRHVAVLSDGENVNIWDWRRGRIERTVEKPRGAPGHVESNPLRYSPDGRWLAACDSKAAGNVVIRVWDAGSGALARDITDPDLGPGCVAMDFTPDGKFLLWVADRIGLRQSEVIAHSVGTWERAWVALSELDPVSIAVSPDGKLAAVAGVLTIVPKNYRPPRIDTLIHEPTIDLVTLNERKTVGVIKTSAMGPITWSPDGTRIALAGHLIVEMFEVPSGRQLVYEQVDKSGSMHVRYTRDGRYLIESDLNGMGKGLGVKIWDGPRQRLLQTIPGDIGNIALSKDGKYLAVGSTGHTTVWEFK